MYFDIHYNRYYYHDISIVSLTEFFNQELKGLLPQEFQQIEICNIQEIVIENAIEDWLLNNDFDSDYSPFPMYKNQILNGSITFEEIQELYEDFVFYRDLRGGITKHPEKDFLSAQHNIIYEAILEYNYFQFLDLFKAVKSFMSTEYNILIDKESLLLFKSIEAIKWFIETIDEKFDLNNGEVRGFNAFLKAIIDDEDVKQIIFNATTTQKQIVEFVNKYYKRTVIKNADKLSDPAKHSEFIKYRISEFKKKYT